jgi:hypothetical protein
MAKEKRGRHDFLGDIADIAKIGAFIIGFLYIVGLVIFNEHLGSYGVGTIQLAKPEFFVVGIAWTAYAGLGLAGGAAIFVLFWELVAVTKPGRRLRHWLRSRHSRYAAILALELPHFQPVMGMLSRAVLVTFVGAIAGSVYTHVSSTGWPDAYIDGRQWRFLAPGDARCRSLLETSEQCSARQPALWLDAYQFVDLLRLHISIRPRN